MSRIRFVSVALLAALLVPVFNAFPATAAPLPKVAASTTLDLPWIALRPDDAGPGYRRDRALYQSLSAAAELTYSEGPELTALVDGMVLAGWQAAYFAQTELPTVDDPFLVARRVNAVIHEYADVEGGIQGQFLLAAAHTAKGDIPSGEIVAAGDEAVLFENSGNAFQGGGAPSAPYQGLRLIFRTGELVGNVSIQYFTETPTAADIEIVAMAMIDRIAAAQAGQAPDLSLAVARFDPAGLRQLGDQYRLIDGATVPRVG